MIKRISEITSLYVNQSFKQKLTLHCLRHSTCKMLSKVSITVTWLTFTPMNSIFKKHFQKFLNRFVYKCRREFLIVRVRRHIWCILSFIIHDKNYSIAYYQCDYMLFTLVYEGQPWYLELFLLQVS